MTVTVGTQTPVLQNVSDTSFTVDLAPEPAGLLDLVITRLNGLSASECLVVATPGVAFVTSTVHQAGFGGQAGADAICTARAAAAGLSGTCFED